MYYYLSMVCLSVSIFLTCVNSLSTRTELANATPQGYTRFSYPRTNKNRNSNKTRGAAWRFSLKNLLQQSKTLLLYKPFESSSITLKLSSATVTVFNIYRPPPRYHLTTQNLSIIFLCFLVLVVQFYLVVSYIAYRMLYIIVVYC